MVNGTASKDLARGFDRAIGLGGVDGVGRSDLLDTAMLRPMGFAMAGLGFLLMTAGAFWVLRAPWTAAWLATDAALLAARAALAARSWIAGTRVPDGTARLILVAAAAMFVVFGAGCAASFLSGSPELRIASAIAVMGLLSGVAVRWAGLPRLARGTILAVSAPMAAALAATHPLSAALFVVLALGTAVLAAQNNRTLLAMMAAERTARRLATTDALTGLLNRAGLEAAMADAPLAGGDAMLLFMDLDGFKSVNDRHGHAAGDQVLAEVGARLAAAAPGAALARLGGDEFVLVLPGGEAASASALARLIREGVGAPIALGDAGAAVCVGVSCGIASGSLANGGAAALLAAADKALYETKRTRLARLRRDDAGASPGAPSASRAAPRGRAA